MFLELFKSQTSTLLPGVFIKERFLLREVAGPSHINNRRLADCELNVFCSRYSTFEKNQTLWGIFCFKGAVFLYYKP